MEKQDEKTLNVKEKQKYHSEATLKWLSPSIDKGQWAFLLKMWVNIPTLSLTSSVTWVTYSLKNLVFLIHTLSNSNLYFLCVLRIKRNDLCRKPSVQFNHSVVSNSLQPHGLTAAFQASLSFTISWSLLKLMSSESVMPSNHLVLCCSLLLPSFFPVSGSLPMSRLFL